MRDLMHVGRVYVVLSNVLMFIDPGRLIGTSTTDVSAHQQGTNEQTPEVGTTAASPADMLVRDKFVLLRNMTSASDLVHCRGPSGISSFLDRCTLASVGM